MQAERRQRSCITFTQSSVTPRRHCRVSCPTAAGQHLGYPILLLTPPSSCPTDQKLLHFLQGYQILPALGSAGLQGGRKQQEPKAGDGRKGIEGQPAAHWAGSAIKTAPDWIKIIRNCALTSQKQKNEEFKVGKCGFALEYPDVAIQHSQPGSSRQRGEGLLDLQQQENVGSSPSCESAQKHLPGEPLLKHCQPQLLPH